VSIVDRLNALDRRFNLGKRATYDEPIPRWVQFGAGSLGIAGLILSASAFVTKHVNEGWNIAILLCDLAALTVGVVVTVRALRWQSVHRIRWR
jgi:hypothetical protein